MKFVSSACLIFTLSCSSLPQSKTDRQSRFQGSFGCGEFSKEKKGLKESLAEADVSRIRCAKDEWRIERESVIFTRTFFQSKQCDTVLGQVTFQSPYRVTDGETPELAVYKPRCKIIRKNTGWVAENSGKCMLNRLELNAAYDLNDYFKCRVYVPEFCYFPFPMIAVHPSASGAEAYASLSFSSGGRMSEGKCTRYAIQ